MIAILLICCINIAQASTVQPLSAVLIIKNESTIYSKVSGCASLNGNKCLVKATLDTPFPICSISKQFTAAAILMLEEQGKLSTSDYINKYIPNLPNSFNGIKIKDLLFHISGIPDYFTLPLFNSRELLGIHKLLTESDIFAAITNLTLNSHDESYNYSNSDYLLLTKIIENVSGQSYADFMQKNFFNKFNMKDAFVISNIKLYKNYALPYINESRSYTVAPWISTYTLSGEGGMFISINDIKQWIKAVDQKKLFNKPQTMHKFLSIAVYSDDNPVLTGDDFTYGYGLFHGRLNLNNKVYSITRHPGGMPGTASLLSNMRYESENLWVFYVNNAGIKLSESLVLSKTNVAY